MAQRRDFPVTDEQLAKPLRCARCKKQIVWAKPITYTKDIPLDVASRQKDPVFGVWRLEVHFAYCTSQPRKPRKKFGGHRSVGTDERCFD